MKKNALISFNCIKFTILANFIFNNLPYKPVFSVLGLLLYPLFRIVSNCTQLIFFASYTRIEDHSRLNERLRQNLSQAYMKLIQCIYEANFFCHYFLSLLDQFNYKKQMKDYDSLKKTKFYMLGTLQSYLFETKTNRYILDLPYRKA